MRNKCIKRICEFARDSRSGPYFRVTGIAHYQETTYERYFSEITQEDIERFVEGDPSLVEDWLSFTDDKRCTPSWGLRKHLDKWLVFHITRAANFDYELVFDSPIRACAMMIRMEMENFRFMSITKVAGD